MNAAEQRKEQRRYELQHGSLDGKAVMLQKPSLPWHVHTRESLS